MSQKILQLNFKFSVTGDEYTQAASSLASQFASLPGLIWKVWMINESKQLEGGIYFFQDEASVKAYLDSPLAAQVMSHPALIDFDAKIFDVMDEVTAVTRGPVN